MHDENYFSPPNHYHLPTPLSQSSNDKPVQPSRSTVTFPPTLYDCKKRSFNPSWYSDFQWLEYSVERNRAFCFACRHFTIGGARSETSFTNDGFGDWKHELGKNGILQGHSKCLTHTQAMSTWLQFKGNKEKSTLIENHMSKERKEQISRNRHYISSIAEAILLCAHLEISLQGHNESHNSVNKGNFIEILNVVGNHDAVVKEQLEHGPKNAKYTSPEIQNYLLQIMSDMVRKSITDAVKYSGYFSLLADESKDCGKKEQLSIALRYVDSKAIIHEHFITFIEAESLTAESLATYLIKFLTDFNLDASSVISQGYDGASVMSGRLSGIQQRIKAVAPCALYVHCYAHTLNLAIVDSVKCLQFSLDFFNLLEALCVFIFTAKAHAIYIEKQ